MDFANQISGAALCEGTGKEAQSYLFSDKVQITEKVENWLNNDMIGRTGMVDSFNVSLSASFIRKKSWEKRCVKLKDQFDE